MDKSQALQLLKKGKEEWNTWAQQTLSSRTETDAWRSKARCDFSDQAFSGYLDLSGFIFPGDVRFRAARFKETVRFEGAQFHGQADFYEATFGHIADFRRAVFHSDFLIAGATLERGPLTCGGASFLEKADFRPVEGNAALFLEDATFAQLPDFHGAAFRTPRLDNVKLADPFTRRLPPPRRSAEPRGLPLRFMKLAADTNVHAKLRILKKMAEEGHDRDRSLEFAALEVMARRFWVDKAFGRGAAKFWLGVVYGAASNFGRSVGRPLTALLVVTLLFTAFYWSQQSSWASNIDGPAPSGWDQVGQFLGLRSVCVGDAGNSSAGPNALNLSLKNTLLFLAGERSEEARRAYICLYGKMQDEPYIPAGVFLAAMLQSAISAVCLFLLGLALRNIFRIR